MQYHKSLISHDFSLSFVYFCIFLFLFLLQPPLENSIWDGFATDNGKKSADFSKWLFTFMFIHKFPSVLSFSVNILNNSFLLKPLFHKKKQCEPQKSLETSDILEMAHMNAVCHWIWNKRNYVSRYRSFLNVRIFSDR